MTLSFLILATIKASLLLGSALLCCALFRRMSAAGKHLVCLTALCGAMLLPLLMMFLPPWFALPSLGAAVRTGGTSAFPTLAAIWLTGFGFMAMRSGRRLLIARRLLNRGREVRDARLLAAAIAARREIGTRVPIRILTDPNVKVPMTTGVLKPTLLLPEDAAGWSLPRLRAILLHETAHLARRDALCGLISAGVCAVWWFLPLSWLVAGRLCLYREVACDDRVINQGARRSGYAALLLDCFQRFPLEKPALAGAAVLGSRHDLHRRVQSLVDARTHRHTSRRGTAAVVFATAVLTLILATSGRANAPLRPGTCSNCIRIHTQASVSVTFGAYATAVSPIR